MEQKIVKALPTMVDGLLRKVTGEASTATCQVISGLVTEAENNIKDAKRCQHPHISLIASGQQVEHHEIAIYATLGTWAVILGQRDNVAVPESTFQEEEAADGLLTQIAEHVDLQAAA